MKKTAKTFLKLIMLMFTVVICTIFISSSNSKAAATGCRFCHGSGWMLYYDLFDEDYSLIICDGLDYILDYDENVVGVNKFHEPLTGSITVPTTYDVYDNHGKYIETVPVKSVILYDRYEEKYDFSIKITDITTQAENVDIRGCDSLETVTLSEGVKSLNIVECPKAMSIYFPTTIESISYGESGTGGSFIGTVNIVNAVFAPGTTTIPSGALICCTNLKDFSIPDSVTTISSGAFRSCSSLENIILPDGLKILGDYSFKDCSNIKNIILPEGLTSIGISAFANTGIKEIVVPESVTELFFGEFSGCKQLEEATVKSKVLSRYMFDSCENLKKITLSEGVTTIPERFATFTKKLESINIPSTVETIEADAFYDSNLQSINLPKSIKKIDRYALYSNNLKDIYYEGTAQEWSSIEKHYLAFKTGVNIHYNNPLSSTCACNCHKTGFIGFIWNIINFFQKLFRTNQLCSCGAAHY